MSASCARDPKRREQLLLFFRLCCDLFKLYCRILCSSLHIVMNYFMMFFKVWDQAKISRFRWLWQDVTTFENYANETSYENSLMIQQTGGLAMSSLIHVMRSLTPNARGIFMLLAKYQLDNKDNNTYQGTILLRLAMQLFHCLYHS